MRLDSLEAYAAPSGLDVPDAFVELLTRSVREAHAATPSGLFNPLAEALAGAVRNDFGAYAASVSDGTSTTHWRMTLAGHYDALLIERIDAAGDEAHLLVLDAPEH